MEYQKQTDIIKFLFSDCVEDYTSYLFVGCLNNGTMKELKYKTSNIEKIGNLKYSSNCDYYITANTIKNGRKREKKEIFGIHNICIDIDLHSSNDNINKIAENLKYFLVEGDCLPLPSVFVKTGRGVQLWWHFEECSSRLIFMYQALTQFIINQLDDLIKSVETLSNLRVDAPASKNIVGYFRLPFTTNTKTTTLAVAEILNPDTYNLIDMFNDYCDIENVSLVRQNVSSARQNKNVSPVQQNVSSRIQNKNVLPVTQNKNATISSQNEYISLIMKRKKFIEQYCINREFCVTGCRDLIMFLYCVCLFQVMNVDFIMLSMKKLNNQFSEPLEQSKLDSIFNYMSKKKVLKFKQETFLSFLPVTDEERKEYFSNTKHNGTRDINRKITKEERNQNIIKLAIDGKTTEQIAQEVNCSVRTVKSFLKSINFNRADYFKSQVVQLVAQGLSITQISKQLNISISTVNRLKK